MDSIVGNQLLLGNDPLPVDPDPLSLLLNQHQLCLILLSALPMLSVQRNISLHVFRPVEHERSVWVEDYRKELVESMPNPVGFPSWSSNQASFTIDTEVASKEPLK